MAIVTRYFSTTGAGAADGTTWADRAALYSGGWSTVITGFDFVTGADSLECRIQGGLTYTIGATLAPGNFTNPPSDANPLVFVGCDSSGNRLAIPEPSWKSCEPAWDDSTLPVLDLNGNFSFTEPEHYLHLIKITSSLRTGGSMYIGEYASWCVFINSTANANAVSAGGTSSIFNNCVMKCTGSSYSRIFEAVTLYNCRVEGVTGSSGSRCGCNGSNANMHIANSTIFGMGGDAITTTSTSVNQSYRITKCVIANCGGTGFKPGSTASQASLWQVDQCIVTGCGAYGIDAQSAARLMATSNRLRDNTSGNFGNFANYPTDLNNYTTDAADADDYVDASGGDFRIKNTAAIWGMGFGVSDEPAAGGGGGPLFGGRLIG